MPPDPGPPQIWHHQLHEHWADEDLTFWRLAFFPRYESTAVLDIVHGVFERQGIISYAIYETLGLFDMFIRAWLPSHTAEKVKEELNNELLRESLQLIESFGVTRILRHHVWRPDGKDRQPDKGLLGSPMSDETIQRLNEGQFETVALGDEPEQDRLLREGILAPLKPSEGVKFFTTITSAVFSVTHGAREELMRGLIRALESSGVQEPSLYQGSGFGEYVLMGRASFSDFFAITRLSTAINDLGIYNTVTARPYTHVCAHPHPLFHADRMPIDADGDKIDLAALLTREESQTFEVKGSLSHDLDRWLSTSERDPVRSDTVIDEGVVKAVVGMLNADGGHVVLGALERGAHYGRHTADEHPKLAALPRRGDYICLGVNAEYDDRGPDSFRRRLQDLLSSRIQPAPAGSISVSREAIEGRDLYIIGVQPTMSNWFYRVTGPKDPVKFYVREGNRTLALAGISADDYKNRKRG